MQVPLDDGLASEDGINGYRAEERSQGQAGGGEGAFTAGECDGEDAEEGGGEGSEEQGEDGGSGAEPGGDHGEEFDVAEAEAFLVTDERIDPADQKQKQGRADAAEDGCAGVPEMVRQSVGRQQRRVDDAERDAGEGEGVGEAHGFGVHDGEAEE